MKSHFKNYVWDKSGIIISSLCIFHCTLFPVLIGLLPFLGLRWAIHNPKIHLSFFILMVIFAISAYIMKFKEHQSYRPAFYLVFGITLVGLGHFVFADHSMHSAHAHHLHHQSNAMDAFNLPTILAIFGGLSVIRGHYLNQKIRSCCLR